MTDFLKLKEFDVNALKAENNNLKVLLSSLKSEKEMEIEVLKSQNKEYSEIFNNIQEKANQHYIEIQKTWENKYFILETKHKKLEIELEKTQRLLSETQNQYSDANNMKLEQMKQNKNVIDEFKSLELEAKKYQEKYLISEERIRDLLAKNEFLYSELQKYKKENDVSQLKLEQYLNDFQKNVATLENSLQKSNASAQNLQRQNDIKQQQLDQLKNDFFEYQQKFEKIQEGTHNEMSEILQKYEENFRKLKTQSENQKAEVEKLNMIIFKLKQELEETKEYYGNLMGNLQENIRLNIKETLAHSKFSSPIRKEGPLSTNGINYSGSGFSPLETDISMKFIHKYN